MAAQATPEKGTPTGRLIQGLGPAALILLLAYLLVIILQHSDVELIHPETRVDLKSLSKGILSGSIVTPLLDLKLSVFLFLPTRPAVRSGNPRLRDVARDLTIRHRRTTCAETRDLLASSGCVRHELAVCAIC